MTAHVTDGLDGQLLRTPRVRRGQMFGHPAYYVNGKLFACVYGEALGLKLPEGMATDLIAQGRAEPGADGLLEAAPHLSLVPQQRRRLRNLQHSSRRSR